MRRLMAGLVGLTVVLGACASTKPRSSAATSRATTTTSAPDATGPAGATATTDPTPPPGSSIVAMPTVSPLSYSATPGGPPAGQLPTFTWGDPTVRPVVSQTAGWVQIGLDTRPNQSTAWVDRSSVTLAVTAYRIEISISKRSLTLYQGGQSIYSAPVGVGQPQWPTPKGRTFVDAIVPTPKFQLYIYGPTVVILGVHSNVFTEFDGGDGTVAIHAYPSDPASTNGVASSHGCVRTSAATITAIAKVPLGTPVDIVA